jgi:serine protease Do
MSFYDKVRRQKFLSFSLILFTLAIGVLIGTVVQTGAKAAKESAVAADATPLVIPSPVQLQNDFSKIAKRLEPSVVNISTEYIPKSDTTTRRTLPRPNSRNRGAQPPDDEDDNGMQQFFQRFFGGPGGGDGSEGFQFGEPQDSRSAALGSGVVVDKNGYILTNNHVVEKASRIKVKFTNDPTEYPATVIGTDKDTDLAVIKVDKKNLMAAKIGNSEALQVGDWAMAIGSPFGFQATVTVGIVSALSRDLGGGESTAFQHFIQTDAAINPGNSGGPLINMNGEVIGINTMIASRSGGYQGIGFAMPVNTAVKVYNDIIQTGPVTRGSIGIQFQPDDNASERNKVYGADHGVFVTSVNPDGPAEKAGMKAEDIITDINGRPIRKGQDLIDAVADAQVGASLKVGIVRDKKPMTLNVVVGDRTKVLSELYTGVKPDEKESGAEGTNVRFGMSVQALTAAERQRANLKVNGGVLVASVEAGSFAEDLGLQKGDLVVELNRQPINSTDDLKRVQGNLKPGDAVVFKVMRRARTSRGTGDWQSFFPSGQVPTSERQ